MCNVTKQILLSAVVGTMGQTMSSYKGGAYFKHHTTTSVNV